MNENLTFYLPFQRSAEGDERREVWGWGSTEAFATDGRIITYEASQRAFANWIARGNVREMHQPIAAGRALDYRADDESRRIWVGTRVSRGAESTWQKILDGTLQAFSVRGHIDQMEPRTIQRGSKTVTVPHVLAYTIDELSYVDAPSDPGAQFVSIVRGDGLTDILDEGSIESNPDLTETNVTMVAREGASGGAEVTENKIDPDELARAETVTITPIAEAETPTRTEQSQAQADGNGEGAMLSREAVSADTGDGEVGDQQGTPVNSLVERADGEGGEASAAAEMTQATLAGQILRDLNILIGLEAGELASDESQDVWDVYGLLQARSIVKGFMVQEIVEAVTMARRAEEIDASVTTLQTQLAEAISRLDEVKAAQEAVERGENPVIADLKAQLTEMDARLERYGDQPIPQRPFARGVSVDKMFAGDEQGTLDGGKLMRALETVAQEGPASLQPEAQALAAKVALHEVYRNGPTPFTR